MKVEDSIAILHEQHKALELFQTQFAEGTTQQFKKAKGD